MLVEVPTLAIELVAITENSSCLHDEVISHRLGLIPIDSTNIENFCFKQECNCIDKCPKCSVEYHINVICSNNENEVKVTHYDIIAKHRSHQIPQPVPKKQQGYDDNDAITIVKLSSNQQLQCHLVAEKGIGKIHAKYSPVATAVFKMEPRVIINPSMMQQITPEIKKQIVDVCPRHVFTNNKDSFSESNNLIAYQSIECVNCDECVKLCESLGLQNFIKISTVQNCFHFTVETTGALPPEQIVEIALKILHSKLSKVKDSIQEQSVVEVEHFSAIDIDE